MARILGPITGIGGGIAAAEAAPLGERTRFLPIGVADRVAFFVTFLGGGGVVRPVVALRDDAGAYAEFDVPAGELRVAEAGSYMHEVAVPAKWLFGLRVVALDAGASVASIRAASMTEQG